MGLCLLWDDFTGSVALFNVHSDVIQIKLAAGTRNEISYKTYISDFLCLEK